MHISVRTVAAIIVVSGLVIGTPLVAQAEDVPAEALDAYAALVHVDAMSPADSEFSVLEDLASATSIEEVTVPVSPDSPVVVESDGGVIAVNLPFAETSLPAETAVAGVNVYVNAENFSTVPLVKDDASVQFTTVINGSDSPTAYTYDFPGKTLTLESDGVVTVRAADGSLDGLIAPAWAKDRAGADVSTKYTVEGSLLTQTVEHGPQTAYPVVADPYLGIAQIQSIGSAYRDRRGVTKVVTPTAWGRLNGNNPTAVNGLRDEWNAKVDRAFRTSDMWWQLGCHAQFAGYKPTWNLDSYLRRGSYWAYISNGCN